MTLTRAHGGHTEFKMHASKMVRLKEGERALLNDVEIELYGKDGETVDRIRGGQFEWDPETKKAIAAGPVEILDHAANGDGGGGRRDARCQAGEGRRRRPRR